MYEFYKSMNKNLYEFGKVLIVLAILILLGGLVYVLLMPIFYTQVEINNKLDDFIVFYYIAYCIIPMYLGMTITDIYEKHAFPKNSKKKFLD